LPGNWQSEAKKQRETRKSSYKIAPAIDCARWLSNNAYIKPYAYMLQIGFELIGGKNLKTVDYIG
jgi:hypothetical protein